MERLPLEVAGRVYALEIPSGPVAQQLSQAWKAFLTSKPAATTLAVTFNNESPTAWVEQEPAPRSTRAPDGRLMLEGKGYRAEFSADGLQAKLDCANARYPIDTTFKHLVADDFLRRGGLIVHGVCLTDGTQAALFTGASGAGKSTLAHHASEGGLSIISDELVGVEMSNDSVWAHGTPWNIGSPVRRPLRALGILAWDSSARVGSVHPSEVLRVLASNVVGVDDAPETRNRLFRSASTALSRVSTVRLFFAQNQSVAAVIRAVLSQG